MGAGKIEGLACGAYDAAGEIEPLWRLLGLGDDVITLPLGGVIIADVMVVVI